MITSHLGLNNLDNLLVRDGQMLLGSTIDLRRLVDYVSVVWIGNRVRLLLQVEQSAAAEEGVILALPIMVVDDVSSFIEYTVHIGNNYGKQSLRSDVGGHRDDHATKGGGCMNAFLISSYLICSMIGITFHPCSRFTRWPVYFVSENSI